MRNFVVVAILFLLVPIAISDASDQDAYLLPLVDERLDDRGHISVSNSEFQIIIDIYSEDGWALSRYSIDIGEGHPPMSNAGNPLLGSFGYTERFLDPSALYHSLTVDLADLGNPRSVNVAVYCTLVPTQGNSNRQLNVWAFGPNKFPGPSGGYWFSYQVVESH